MEKNKVFVIGAGAVGTLLAAKLTTCNTTDTTLVTRNSSLTRFNDGITIQSTESKHCNVKCCDWSRIKFFPGNSWILITTKIFDLAEVLSEIKQRLAVPTHLVLCQNGLDVITEADRYLPNQNWIRAICWLGARLKSPATVVLSGMDRIEIASASEGACSQLATIF